MTKTLKPLEKWVMKQNFLAQKAKKFKLDYSIK